MAATKAMTLKPIGDKIIVEVIDEPQTSTGGIILPDTAKKKASAVRFSQLAMVAP